MTGSLRDGLMELSEEVRVVDLHARVLRGSRRAKMRNRIIGSLAALLAMSGAAAAVASARPSPMPVPPAPTESPEPSKSPEVVLPNVDIRNASFAVPAFPGRSRCSSGGTRTFKDGRVAIGEGEVGGELRLVMADDAVRADLDGEPGDEILTRLICSDYTATGQVFALKVAPDGKLIPLGFVLISPDHNGFEVVTGSLRVRDGTVLVDLLGPDRPDGPLAVLDLQTRGYAYSDGKFEQVSGPTKFAQPPEDFRKVDFRNVTAFIRVPGEPPAESSDFLRISDGKGNITINKVSYEVTVLSSALFASTDRPRGVVLYQLKSAGGKTRTFFNVYEMSKAIPGDWGNVNLNPVDLAGATKVATSGEGEIQVTIDGKVRKFREDATGGWVSSA